MTQAQTTATTPHYLFRSDTARQYIAEVQAKSKAEGKAENILKVLELRGIPTPEPFREKVMATTDLDLLETWLARALHVTVAEEIFE